MSQPHGHVLVIGSAGLDIVGRPRDQLRPGSSAPGQLRSSLGGVGRNVAENLARLGTEVVLITAVGDDAEGKRLLNQTAEAGVDIGHVLSVPGQETGAYLAVLDGVGSLHLALDDMRVIEMLTPEFVRERRDLFQGAAAVILDANLPPRTIAACLALAQRAHAHVAADPASVGLAPRLTPHLKDLWLIACSEAEVEALCSSFAAPRAGRERTIDCARRLVSLGVEVAIVTTPDFGLGYAGAEGSGHVPAMQTEIVDPTGAGDALTAAVIFGLLNDIPLDEAVRLGVSAAALTLRWRGSVVPGLSLERLYDGLR